MTGNYLHRRTVSIISAGNSPLVPKSLPVHRVGVSLVLMGFGHHYARGGAPYPDKDFTWYRCRGGGLVRLERSTLNPDFHGGFPHLRSMVVCRGLKR